MKFLITFFLYLAATMAFAQNKQPNNVIIFIADGGGYNQMMCTDFFLEGRSPSSNVFQFPVRLAMSTYNGSLQSKGSVCYNTHLFWSDFSYGIAGYTESAASATAMGTGYKTHNSQIGYNLKGQPCTNLAEIARSKGKMTGVVTSVPFNHATPAGFSAHAITRRGYLAIANQMIFGSTLDVIAGAGHPWFDDSGNKLDSAQFNNIDSLAWKYLQGTLPGSDWTFTDQRDEIKQMANLPPKNTPRRLFMLAPVATTLQQNRYGVSESPYSLPFSPSVPTLAEMSLAALNVLDDDPDGFFLMIEGGAIDWANHDNQLPRMIEEYASFYQAIDSVVQYLEKHQMISNTLVIVTSDHECGYLWGTMSSDSTFNLPINKGKGVLPEAKYYSTDHSNTLVPFFATGPSSDMFFSFADETDIERGPFLTNSEIAVAIKSLWGQTSVIFEPDPLKNDSICLQVTLPCPDASVKWFANNQHIEQAAGMQFLFSPSVYSPQTKFHCEVTCGLTVYITKSYSYRYE